MTKTNQHHLPAVTRIVIQPAPLIGINPKPFFVANVPSTRCRPKEHVALVVINNDPTNAYTIKLTHFRDKAAPPTDLDIPETDLFVAAPPSHKIPANGPTLIARTVRPRTQFGTGAGHRAYTTYEFTIELWDDAGTTEVGDPLDPDLDITP